MDAETIMGNAIFQLLSGHQPGIDGCTCGHASFWAHEHREHQARVIARALSTF